jgi:glutamine synthetase
MLHGIEGKLDSGAPAEGDVSAKADPKIPFQLEAALARLSAARILPEYMGKDYLALYVDAKRAEMCKFAGAISPQEHAWYL